VLALAAAAAVAQTPTTQPADLARIKLLISRLRGDLSHPSPARRSAAVEGLLGLGPEGRSALAEQARRLIERMVSQSRLPVQHGALAAKAALAAHVRWRSAVKGALARIKATGKDDRKGIDAMLKLCDRAVARHAEYMERLKGARRWLGPLDATARRANEYEQAWARAQEGHAPRRHSIAAIAAAAKIKYDARVEALIAAARDAERIAAWVHRHNRKHHKKLDPAEYESLELLNRYRRQMGRPPLALHPALREAASQHAREMARRGYFSHDSPVARHRTPAKRAAAAGYADYRSIGENIAMGSASGSTVYRMWRRSPSHHRNMLAAEYQEVGIARFGDHWTQLLGARRKAPWEAAAEKRAK
jgi:uncharacterized protein YkwD